MSSKSDYIRWWTNYGEMANEEIEYPAFQAGRAFQHSVESSELATLRAQLAEARELIAEAKVEIGFTLTGLTQPSNSTYNKLSNYLKKVITA